MVYNQEFFLSNFPIEMSWIENEIEINEAIKHVWMFECFLIKYILTEIC